MSLNEGLLSAAGYSKDSNGYWTLGVLSGGNFESLNESTMSVLLNDGGNIVKFSTVTTGSHSSANADLAMAMRNGASFPIPRTPYEIRGFHFQEMGYQLQETTDIEKKALTELSNIQNVRIQAEIKLKSTSRKDPLAYSQAVLTLQKAAESEMKSNIKATKARSDVVAVKIGYTLGDVYWPVSNVGKDEAQKTVDEYQKYYDSIIKEIAGMNKYLKDLQTEIEKTAKDVESIKKGQVPEKYQITDEQQEILDAVQKVSDFYSDVTQRFGDAAKEKVKLYQNAAVGKKIKNAQDAIKAWNKYGESINKKFNASDRNAIENALKAVDQEALRRQLTIFNKAFSTTSKVIDGMSLYDELTKAAKTGNWNPFFIKVEALLAGAVASELVAFVFAGMAVTPLGVLAFALILAATSAMIDEALLEDLHRWISTL